MAACHTWCETVRLYAMTASLTDTSPDSAGWFTAAVAAELRAHMARQRVSGREVARRLHVSAQWISLRTKGASPLSTDEIERICDVLGITPQQLLAGAFASTNRVANGIANAEYPPDSPDTVTTLRLVTGHDETGPQRVIGRMREVTADAS